MKIILVTLETYLGMLDTGMIHTYLPLKQMGHDVIIFDYRQKQSKELIPLCEKFKPDLIIYCLAEKEMSLDDMIYIKDVLKINSFGIFVDCVWRYGTYFSDYAKGMNYVVTTELSKVEDYKRDYPNLKGVIHCTLWANPSMFYPMNSEKEIDVSFVGRPHGGRIELINYLISKGIKIKAFGDISSYHKVNEIYNKSKFVLAPSMSSDNIHKQDKLRFYEIVATGTCMLSDYDFKTNKMNGEISFYSWGTEIGWVDSDYLYYETKEQLVEQIKKYLKMGNIPIQSMGANGYNEFRVAHTSNIKLQYILRETK